jgi:pimeloyl-ACP methyl ester carboxylesterase
MIPVQDVAALACDLVYPRADHKKWADPNAAWRLDLPQACLNSGWTLVASLVQDNAQAIVASRGRTLVVAVRGTDAHDRRDIEHDTLAMQVSCENYAGRIHAGFLAHSRLLWPVLSELLKSYTDKNKIVFTGHSLGGSVATLLADRASRESTITATIAAVVTFGAPSPGNKIFLRSCKVPIHRVLNQTDIVPWLPPTFLLGFLLPIAWGAWPMTAMFRPWVYARAGTLYYYSSQNTWWVGKDAGWFRCWRDRLWLRLKYCFLYVGGFKPSFLSFLAVWLFAIHLLVHLCKEVWRRGGTSGIVNHNRYLYLSNLQTLLLNV